MKYVVYCFNRRTRSFRVVNIHDSACMAEVEVYASNRDCKKRHLEYFFEEIDTKFVQCLIDKYLIDACKTVAMSLNLADICIMKRGKRSLERSRYFFERAKYHASRGALYFD